MSLSMQSEKPSEERTFSSRIENIALSVFLVAGVLLTYGCFYPVGTHGNESIPAIQTLQDPSYYSTDFYVQESTTHFTPRTYCYYATLGLCRLGLTPANAHFILYALAIAGYVLGLQAIARLLGKTKLTTALLIVWGFLVSGSELGMTRLQFNTPIPSVYAMGVTLWGIYFALRYRWILAFSLFGCACILQFLVGLLPAMLCTPLMFLCVFRERQWKTPLIALLVFGVGAAVVYLPMRLGGSTASVLLSDQEFVNLYGQIVLPHHIVPSAWPLYDWMDALIFFTGGILISYRCQANASLRLATVFIVGFVAFFLTLNYVFVEIWPWALIAKLQFGRMVPFAVLSILFPLVLLFDEQYRAGRYWVCGGLAAAPMAPYGGLLLALLAVFWTPLEHFQKKITARDSCILGVFTFAAIFAYAPSLERSTPIDFTWAIPLILMAFLAESLRRKISPPSYKRIALCVALALGTSAAVYVEATGLTPESWPRRINLNNVDDDQITRLAAEYQKNSKPDALILIPPAFQHFRRYSERSVVVDFKGMPFTDAGILEWKRRMEIVLGTAVTTDSYEFDNLFTLYFAQSTEQLVKIAHQFHATHILSHLEFQNAPLAPLGKVIAQEQLWVIWEVPLEIPSAKTEATP